LVEAGVPKDKIVLGFKSPERRKDTEFAVAWKENGKRRTKIGNNSKNGK
jgi:hypothetical protein